MSETLFDGEMLVSEYVEGSVDVSEYDEIYVEGNTQYVKITGEKNE